MRSLILLDLWQLTYLDVSLWNEIPLDSWKLLSNQKIVFIPLCNLKLLSRAQFSLSCDVKLLTRLLLFSREVFRHNSIQFDEFHPNLSKLWNPLNPLILIFFHPLRFSFTKSVYKIFSRDVGKFLMDFFRFESGEGWRRTFFLFTWPDKKKVFPSWKNEWRLKAGWSRRRKIHLNWIKNFLSIFSSLNGIAFELCERVSVVVRLDLIY